MHFLQRTRSAAYVLCLANVQRFPRCCILPKVWTPTLFM